MMLLNRRSHYLVSRMQSEDWVYPHPRVLKVDCVLVCPKLTRLRLSALHVLLWLVLFSERDCHCALSRPLLDCQVRHLATSRSSPWARGMCNCRMNLSPNPSSR